MNTYYSEQLENKKADLVAVQGAIDALIVGGVQSYKLNTMQTDQSVTKLNLGDLQRWEKRLESQIATLNARVNGATIALR